MILVKRQSLVCQFLGVRTYAPVEVTHKQCEKMLHKQCEKMLYVPDMANSLLKVQGFRLDGALDNLI